MELNVQKILVNSLALAVEKYYIKKARKKTEEKNAYVSRILFLYITQCTFFQICLEKNWLPFLKSFFGKFAVSERAV